MASDSVPVPALRRWWWLIPSFADLIFAALLAALFGQRSAWISLLADGDTGWHIRTGEWILAHGAVPVRDLFSFSRPGAPWFAWEWGSDVAMALLYRWHGLGAVAGVTACLLCAAAVVIFCWLLRRGCGLWIAAAATFAAVSASSIHYLARPHVVSLLLFPASLWILEEDRRRPSPRVWWLVPLAGAWANFHAGFAAWLAVLGLAVVVAAWERDRRGLKRMAALAGLSALATLVNPYGIQLHLHIARYLGSGWIQDSVQEFQSPRFRSENMLVFAALLLGGVGLASRLWPQGRRFETLLVLVWAVAALRSARHVPLYAAAAVPVIGGECALWWRERAQTRPHSPWALFWSLAEELTRHARPTLWMPATAVLVVAVCAPAIADFPATRFPAGALAHCSGRLAPPGAIPRILTSDQWADYLIFHLYPRQRVFFDGRSDFYGPELGKDYLALLSVTGDWRGVLQRYRFDLALLPADWPLAAVLEGDPQWTVRYRDAVGILLERRGGTL